MHRRALLASVTALFATSAWAVDKSESKTFPADKLFPFLDDYYGLPLSERNEFRLAYRLMVQGARADQISLMMADGTRITADPRNTLSPLPSPAQLKANMKLTVTRPANAKCSVSLDVLPIQPPSQTMDARNLATAVNQACNGAKKVAGLFAMVVPTLDRIGIHGVSSGQVRLANGETRTLLQNPASKEKNGTYHPAYLVFVPDEWPTAVSLVFDDTPSRVLIISRS